MANASIIFTTQDCIGCHRCVRVCPARGANVADGQSSRTRINVDSQRCIGCGACVDACDHGARTYSDDTDRFFAALDRGEPISVLIDPSLKVSYPEEYGRVLGWLKEIGVHHIVSASFGADICTWAYLNHIVEGGCYGAISTTCPVVVSYVQKFVPELIPRLMPVQSPLGCAATYCRKELGITDRLAFIGPCIEKKNEIADAGNDVEYNVTFQHFMPRAREACAHSPEASDEVIYGLGALYPMPGGLRENMEWFLGEGWPVRQIEGPMVFPWLSENVEHIATRQAPYALIEALSCSEGCLRGPASEDVRSLAEEARWQMLNIRGDAAAITPAWDMESDPVARFQALNEQFAHLDLNDYLRHYEDLSVQNSAVDPSPQELEDVFVRMHKLTPESRSINCSFCGYDSCREMAVNVFNGFNEASNCIYFQKEEALRLERLSRVDQLTGCLNRNAYERLLRENPDASQGLCVILGDINGLKDINDRQGHRAGDQLIRDCATCMLEAFGELNVYRIGGDEFLAVCRGYDKDELDLMFQRFRASLGRRGVSMSLGMAYQREENITLSQLVSFADARMYEQKRAYYKEHGAR